MQRQRMYATHGAIFEGKQGTWDSYESQAMMDLNKNKKRKESGSEKKFCSSPFFEILLCDFAL